MFRKTRVYAFQLIEAILALSVLSIMFTVGTIFVERKEFLNKRGERYLFETIVQQQKHAFFLRKSITLTLATNQLRIEMNGEKEDVYINQTCTSNFELGILKVTENGTWERGGSIWCESQTITIGIGSSVPRIYEAV